jgi:hypothetical protein
MNVFAALLHMLNFCTPALGVALILTGLSRTFWRKPLRSIPYLHQVILTSAVGVLVLALGLLLEERDGRVGIYIVMLIGQALILWWPIFRNPTP